MAAEIELIPNGTVTSAKGFSAGAIFAGINKYARHKLDLGILLSEVPCAAAGLFTANRMKAAPVLLCQQKLPSNTAKAVVVNSGCANAGTGEQGMADAAAVVDATAEMIEINPQDVLIASTGIIGRCLPLESIKSAIKKIKFSPDGGHSLAKAIMTTDTTTKEVAVRATGSDFIIGGIAKGSGMIHPKLGTMLCFLATDAMVDTEFLAVALKKAVDISFNMVSVDGDTSPNDTVLLMANGLAGNIVIKQNMAQAEVFQEALNHACIHLAKDIARDGEGASKLIEVMVKGAANTEDARSIARTIVSSPLVKTAIHGNDPNWGRIIAAAGRSGAEITESRLDLYIGGICLIKEGNLLPFDKNNISNILKDDEVFIDLNLNLGEATATAWGCNLSEEYVTINSQYTT
ncbi:MAG: bifunctional glutamate N-acetyltransferase/amino-acid acetyltransferase ArgJ [Chloroflexota bacterium]